MLKYKTTFVLGAGASSEYKMPLGSELLRDISGMFERLSDGQLGTLKEIHWQAFRWALPISSYEQGQMDAWHKAAKTLASGIPAFDSIDQLIAAHQSDDRVATLGRLCIAYQIAERESRVGLVQNLQVSPRPRPNFNEGYIRQMWSIILRGIEITPKENLFRNLQVISFNYDRVFQNGIYDLLVSSQLFEKSRCADLVDQIPVVFPYGQWASWRSELDFSALRNGAYMESISKSISTFTSDSSAHNADTVRNLFRDSEVIVFLGFGFHDANLKFLPLPETRPEATVLATVFGTSQQTQYRVKTAIEAAFAPSKASLPVKPIEFVDGVASKLLKDYKDFLAA